MANPNPEIWGAPETWLNAKTWITNAAYNYDDINAGLAKIANFGGNDDLLVGSIRRGITAGKLTFNPIDNTVCPCGQNAAKSAYNSIKMFTNKQDDTLNKIPDKTIERYGAINWCWYYINSAYPQCMHTITGSGALNRGEKRCIIAPNPEQGNPLNNNYNPHNLFTPIVYYGIRSIYGEIWVHEDNNSYGGGAWWTLEDWKNNHSSSPIRDVSLGLYGINGRTTTNLNITGVNLSQGEYISATPLMDIDGVTCYPLFSGGSTGVALIVNSIVGNYYDTSTTFHAIGWRDDYENATIKSHTEQNTDRGWCIWLSIPYSATNYEKIMQMCACFAIPFSDSDHSSYPIDFNANYVCLPVINDSGIATGDYTRGAENLTNPFAQLDSVSDTNYEPNKNVDTNTYNNTTHFPTITGLVSGTNQYILSSIDVTTLIDKMYNIFSGWTNVTYAEVMGKVTSDFLVTEPMQAIVSLHAYPFTPTLGASTTIKLGKYDTNIAANKLTQKVETVNFAGVPVFPRFGDCFLDYEPYTRYEVYVPFCGTVKLNAADILGHNLNVKLKVDMETGVCTGYILADDLCIETVSGTCGVQLPFSGLDTATINANIVSSNIRAKSAESSATASILSTFTPSGLGAAVSNPFGFADKLTQAQLSTEQAKYDLNHIQANPHNIGAASPLTGWCMDLNARLLIYYPTGGAIDDGNPPQTMPKLKDLTTYAHTTGFATVEAGTLSNYTGFTQVSTVDLSGIIATESELNEIRNLLQSGVYL